MWAFVLKLLAGSFVQAEIKKLEGVLIERVKDEVLKYVAGKLGVAAASGAVPAAKEAILKEIIGHVDRLLEEGQQKLGSGEPRAAAWFAEARARLKTLAGQ